MGLCDGQEDCPYFEEGKAIQYLGLPTEAESFWTPTESDIEKFEEELEKGFKKAKKSHSFDPPASFWKYSVQYLGYVKNGQKHILAQGVRCYSPDDCIDLSNGWAMLFDGGTSVFSANFNLKNKTLGGPWFNGYA